MLLAAGVNQGGGGNEPGKAGKGYLMAFLTQKVSRPVSSRKRSQGLKGVKFGERSS